MREELTTSGNTLKRSSIKLADLTHLQADSKYVEAHGAGGSILLDEPLVALEREFGDTLLRIHRSTLVVRSKAIEVERHGEHHYLHVEGVIGTLKVSRRYVAKVRQQLSVPA
ncbi:two-component system, LytT family, response regulator AlgR [Geopseudomonas sagittaria]|uniref:Two-component system, LytT family, response regulator AlgR n=1 Tax=Geopseudomonas sagittaria TaxID=1135990 RepID=A0A1I5YQZ9_9GAMM|nr:LytTR family DNA-binding domain-containing protein [Pseudomonas sagittaria]SFQ46651.1 two-component system, LytT family, response regulator AlgR [Pseudomonas sagittaria]